MSEIMNIIIYLSIVFMLLMLFTSVRVENMSLENKQDYCNSFGMEYRDNYCFDSLEGKLRRIEPIEYKKQWVFPIPFIKHSIPIKFKLVKEVVILE